ncbi:MAG: efflux RND transporter periplasmic adaptor subunit [Candidatus Omnitrophica bacterium]|nr:efflux RND transporter periplasmic adaptor subunit [Candidatus Omnitrophota bacterium]
MKFRYSIFIISLIVLCGACDPHKIDSTKKFSGTLELTEHSLGAKANGGIVTLSVDEGDEVKAGQQLATLDRYVQAKKDYERMASLVAQGGATQQSLEYAALTLDDQQIISPIDGIVLVKVHEVGEVVQVGSPVLVIGDRSQLWVKIFVPEGRINQIHIGQSASISFDGLEDKSSGHVSFIATKAEYTPRNVQTQEERITQAFAVKITLDQPSKHLRPGVAADVILRDME